jgi:type III secretion protein N (ATPase)
MTPTTPRQAAIRSLEGRIQNARLLKRSGRLLDISTSRLTARLEGVAIGEMCEIVDRSTGYAELARVVAIHDGLSILAPLGPVEGLSSAAMVFPAEEDLTFQCSDDLLGRLVDGLGRPIDGQPNTGPNWLKRRITAAQINPLSRPPIDAIFKSGIKSIDALNTFGEGQRIGVFGDPGSGKSTLLGALARNADADVCVLAMIGERGREVREFLDRQLPPSFRSRSVVVASTSDAPAIQRILGGYVANSIAEYFREQGKRVLPLFDSITRFARALREVGLAAGESAVRRGFTPSVYAELPKLIERSGRTEKGSITAIYTVLTENDGLDDPIAEEVRSLTDGHIVLSAELAQAGRYPAIDALKSRSRLMNEIVTPEHQAAASRIRLLMSKFLEVELLVQVGEYRPGSDALADEAIGKRDMIAEFLSQPVNDRAEFAATLQALFDRVARPL